MQSALLLALVLCMLGIPGVGASFAAFAPGELSFVTWSAAVFGLGYAAAGGCAFILASTHTFRLSFFIPLWVVVSAVVWILALRRAPLRDHLHGLAAGIREQRYPLLLGGVVVLAILAIAIPFLHYLGGPHYVYYLNGVEIANSHGTPSETLEYGQAWAPATDKIFLDSFTGVLVLFDQNPLVGPGVLLWVSLLGAALGLWASAWELGIRRTGGLLPLLLLGNGVIFTTFRNDYTEYRAEDFGRAVAFCALALGIFAIRKRKWRPAVIAGLVLGVATGTHLIPVVVVVLALCFFGVAQLIRDRGKSAWIATLRQEIIVGATCAVIGLIIRVLAGGTFGLTGASNQAAYAAIHTKFDPTAYVYGGAFLPNKSTTPYWPPHQVIDSFVTSAVGFHGPAVAAWLLLAGALVAAVLLFVLVPTDLRTVGVVALGVWAGLVGISLFFSYRYHIYIDGTFGVRRLRSYASVGLILLGLGVLEGLLLLIERFLPSLKRIRPPAMIAAAAAIPVLSLTVWLLPSSGVSPQLSQISQDRLTFVDWVRAHTSCRSRFLVNQRSEGTFTSLTGREALTEGMGPFLRPSVLPYVVKLLLSTRHFYHHPQSSEAFLRRHDINYVVVGEVGELIGYAGPASQTGQVYVSAMRATSFLRPVLVEPYVRVYRVVGVHPPAASPLLKGSYLHCRTQPANF